jgi:hypothetical protein
MLVNKTQNFIGLKIENRLGMLTHACNSNYSGSGDREDCSSRPALTKSETPPAQQISWSGGTRL